MLTSLHNDQVKHVISLQQRKYREESKEFAIEGWHLLDEALRRGARIKQVFFCPESKSQEAEHYLKKLKERCIPVTEVDERVLRKICLTEEPQGILAVIHQQEYAWEDFNFDDKTTILVLDGIQDPGNLGTILRTALAAGVNQVCLTKGTVDVYNPKVLRSTMGAIFALKLLSNLSPEEILNFCNSKGCMLITGDTSGVKIYEAEIKLPIALVVGNEGKGPAEVFRRSNILRVTIPMQNEVESLNVGTATAVLLYEIVRRRDFSGK